MSGGGKGAKSAKAPDYSALAAQQGAINQQAASQLTSANRPNQVDPFGNSISWTGGGVSDYSRQHALEQLTNQHNAAKASGDKAEELRTYNLIHQGGNYGAEEDPWTQTQTLNPETKAAWETYMKNANQASSSYGDILNKYLSGYSQGPGNADFASGAQNLKDYNDPEFNGKEVSDALYGSVMDRGRVEQQRESDSLTSQLRNSGLQPGSEAYNRAMQNLMTSQNDANLLAGQNATLAGANEGRAKYAAYLGGQGQQYGQDLSTYGANSQNYQLNRNQPLQELAGMAGIAGGTPYQPTYQGFSGATGYNPTDLVGAAQAQYGAKQAGANASNSKKSGLMGAGASLGGSYLGSK